MPALRYQSCSGRVGVGGTFGGELIFVPGKLSDPQAIEPLHLLLTPSRGLRILEVTTNTVNIIQMEMPTPHGG